MFKRNAQLDDACAPKFPLPDRTQLWEQTISGCFSLHLRTPSPNIISQSHRQRETFRHDASTRPVTASQKQS